MNRVSSRYYFLWAPLAVAILAALILSVHGRSLRYGLFMDDYAHYRQLRDSGWSLADLTRACQLDLVGRILDCWWMPDCTLRFFRPVAFGLMKLVYTLTDWRPSAMHAASLGWHLLNSTLLLALLYRLGAGRGLSLGIAALFALHPGHVATVQWIASQTELIVTAFILTALLSFGAYRGWFQSDLTNEAPRRPIWLALAAIAYVLALGCRENAIMLPVVALAVDLTRGAKVKSIIKPYALLGALALVYLVLRVWMLGGGAIPPRPYVLTPAEPDFPRFILDKTAYYLMCEFLLVPCVPLAGVEYFRSHPFIFYGCAAAIVALMFWIVRNGALSRGGRCLGLVALLGFMMPVLPAFESPHHLYLPSVGWAILMASLLRSWGIPTTASRSRAESATKNATERPASSVWLAWRRGAIGAGVVSAIAFFALLTVLGTTALSLGQEVEDRVVAETLNSPRPLHDGDSLYYLNLPMIAHYVGLAVEQRSGLKNVKTHALCWSPWMLGMETVSEIKWLSDRSFEVRLADGRYFAGPLGRLAREATRGPTPLSDSAPRHGDGFTVEPVGTADAEGVQGLRFTFDESLRRPDVHVFFGSRTRWACRIEPPPEIVASGQ